MFKLLKTEGAARRGEFTCPHGTVQTPVFMNVGTQAAIKGALSAEDLERWRLMSAWKTLRRIHTQRPRVSARQDGSRAARRPW